MVIFSFSSMYWYGIHVDATSGPAADASQSRTADGGRIHERRQRKDASAVVATLDDRLVFFCNTKKSRVNDGRGRRFGRCDRSTNKAQVAGTAPRKTDKERAPAASAK